MCKVALSNTNAIKTIIHLKAGNTDHVFRVGDCVLENSDSERDLEVIRSKQLNVSSQMIFGE